MPENWWEQDTQDEGNWWEQDEQDSPAAAPQFAAPQQPKPSPWDRPPSTLEKVQQASTGFVSGLPGIFSGLAKEAGLVANRAAQVPGQIASGMTSLVADRMSPEVQAADIKRALQKYEMEKKLTGGLEATPDERWGEGVGRGVARAAPQVALAAMTGGATVPVQMGLGAAAQGAQSLSEGAGLGEAALAAGTAGIGQGIGGAVSKLVAPAKGSLNTRAIEAARRLGIELPASAQSTSRAAQYIEGAASKMLGGQRIVDRAADATEALAGRGDDIVSGIDRGEIGERLSDALGGYKQSWTAAKNAAYQKANLKGIPVAPTQTLERVDALLAEGTLDPSTLGYLQKFRKAISPAVQGADPELPGYSVTPKDATKILSHIRALQSKGQSYLTEPWAAKNKGLFRELANTLTSDLDEGVRQVNPELLGNYQKAKDIYMAGARVKESQWAKDIGKLAAAGQPDKIASRIFKPSMSSNDIPRIFETLGPAVTDDVRANVMADLVKMGTSGRNFTPKSLELAVKRWGPDKLKAILSPEQWQQVQDMVEVSKSFAQSNRIQQGSPTAGIANFMGIIMQPVNALRILMGEGAFAKFVGSETGQKWLTTGIMPRAGRYTSGALRGGTAAIAGEVAAAKRRNEARSATR